MINTELLQILENLGFKKIYDPVFNEVIAMSSEDAFIFSSITGAKYLTYENGITMKGRTEIFIHRSVFSDDHLIYSPGLFSRDISGRIIEGNSSKALISKFPDVFDKNNKRIVIYDINDQPSNIENKIFEKIINNKMNPSHYILYKNYPNHTLGESFQEYLASIYFSNKGYLTENQVPWFQQNYKYQGKTLQGGIPDFSAFQSSICETFKEYGIITKQKGLPIVLLPYLSIFRNETFLKETGQISDYEENDNKLIIGEAKTSATSLPQAIKQLAKYNAVNLADSLFTIIPNSVSNNYYGSMYIDNGLNIIYKPGKSENVDKKLKNKDDKWINTYLKMLLLGNIEFSKIYDFITTFRQNNSLTPIKNYEAIHLLDAVQNTNNKDFFKFLKESI